MKKRIFSIILALIIMVELFPAAALSANETDEFNVVVSIEGLTLGQGIYVKPTSYTLDEINSLVADDGFGPYEQADLTAGIATLAFLNDNGLEYTMTGSWDSDAYLSAVKGLDTGTVNVPQIILDNGGSADDGNSDEYLGEFDYNSMSGWMITVNDFMIDVGCGQWGLEDAKSRELDGYDLGNTYVIRWQFTLYGYGADLGVNTGWGNEAYFDGAKKAPLYAAYAENTDDTKKDAALPVMENLTATQDEVDTAFAALTAQNEEAPQEEKTDYKSVLNNTMAQLAATVTEPNFGTNGGEWSVLSLARGGYYATGSQYFEDYYTRIAETVKEKAASVNLNGALHKVKSTENSRLIMALSAIGKDPTNVGGVDILGAYSANGISWIKKQGINGPIFALIAMDTRNYEIADSAIRQQCIDYILSKEISDGGWALTGTTPDPDITSMALQSLAPYKNQANVAAAAERAFTVLSTIQMDNGGYASWGSVNSESIAQVIVACTAWGIDPGSDSRFVKNGASAVDALLEFYVDEGKGFAHVLQSGGGYTGGEVNAMATDQACYALVAYDRYKNGRNSLYDMTDVVTTSEVSGSLSAVMTAPEKVENKAGTTFNVGVSISGWDNNVGYKLLDAIMTIPDVLEVTNVTMGNRISGGSVQWELEKETGKLRIVYADLSQKSDLVIADGDAVAELMTIGLKIPAELDITKIKSLPLAITGMSLKLNSDSSDEAAIYIVDTSKTNCSISVVKGISYTVKQLYQGDGVDLIPENKIAIAVAVTGVETQAAISHSSGVTLYYNVAITEKTGVTTYIALIEKGTALVEFVDADKYSFGTGTANSLTFGDTNDDGVINAEDALAAVNAWLRKGDALTDRDILELNVNGDARINTFDALGIAEFFVDGSTFAVVTRASAED